MDIFIDQGCTYRQVFKVANPELYNFYMAIRKHQESTTIIEPLMTETLDGVEALLSNTETLGMTPMTHIYEVLKRSKVTGDYSVIAKGNAIVSPGLTFTISEPQ